MITTDNDELVEQIRLYRRDGMSTEQKYYHPVVGYNYRLTNIQAAIGVEQVKRAEEILSRKKSVAETYREELTHPDVRFQEEPSWGESAHWMTAPVFKTESQCDRVRKNLSEEDIQTRPFFYPLHKQPPYTTVGDSYSTSSYLSNRGLNLPSSPLLSEEQIVNICNIILDSL
jgi:perosamine synthetase